METVACDLCGADAAEPLFEQTDLIHRATAERFTLVRCRSCGLHYLNPRPTIAEIGRYYATAYSFHAVKSPLKVRVREAICALAQRAFGERGGPGRMAARAAWSGLRLLPAFNRRAHHFLAPRLEPFFSPAQRGRILDVGCGSGETLHLFPSSLSAVSLRAAGWEVSAVEPSGRAREVLTRHGINAAAELWAVQSPADHFDVIRLNWSLEHVHEPTRCLQECKRLLRPGGRLVISVPSYAGITYKLFPTCVEVPIHLYYFDPVTMKRYAAKVGLQVADYYTFSYVGLFLEAVRLMRPDLHRQYLANMDDAVALHSFLRLAGRLDQGDDMTFALTK